MKSEAYAFSLVDLVKSKNSTNHCGRIRNYQARNFIGDGQVQALYHTTATRRPWSSRESRAEAHPDHTQSIRRTSTI